MERKVSFEIDEYYHIYNRGVEKADIFRDVRDRERFLSLLYVYNSEKSFAYRDIKTHPLDFNRGEPIVDVLAYTLMSNHFHLIVRERSQGGISKFLSKILTSYSMYINEKYDRSGPLMCRPFRSQHIDTDEYFLWVFAYVHLNPIQARMNLKSAALSRIMSEYRYSSYYDYFVTDRNETKIISREALPITLSVVGTFDELLGDLVAAQEDGALHSQEQFLT